MQVKNSVWVSHMVVNDPHFDNHSWCLPRWVLTGGWNSQDSVTDTLRYGCTKQHFNVHPKCDCLITKDRTLNTRPFLRHKLKNDFVFQAVMSILLFNKWTKSVENKIFLWVDNLREVLRVHLYTCEILRSISHASVHILFKKYFRCRCCGIVSKVTTGNTGIPYRCMFKLWMLHFWSSILLLWLRKQWRISKCLGPLTHVGDQIEALGFHLAQSLALWPFGKWTSVLKASLSL